MGITKHCCKFLFLSKSLGASFTETLTLGRQYRYFTKKDVINNAKVYNFNLDNIHQFNFSEEYAENLFKFLGAQTLDSIDNSDYEGASIIHDLNQPIPLELESKYSVVFDGGTLEHIFNFPVAIKNCMRLIKEGGHYIGISPVNNCMGHGFYQFSPELFYQVFSKENGFEVIKMIVYATDSDKMESPWYEVANPALVKSRVMLCNSYTTYLMVLAKKDAKKNIFDINPQQSDYVCTWQTASSLKKNISMQNESKLRFILRKFIPKSIKNFYHKIKKLFFTKTVKDDILGSFPQNHFKKIEQ